VRVILGDIHPVDQAQANDVDPDLRVNHLPQRVLDIVGGEPDLDRRLAG
jgi:hypothetical protein